MCLWPYGEDNIDTADTNKKWLKLGAMLKADTACPPNNMKSGIYFFSFSLFSKNKTIHSVLHILIIDIVMCSPCILVIRFYTASFTVLLCLATIVAVAGHTEADV